MGAFTILEIVISLAIMSIIVAMVYSIYVTISEQLYQYSAETELINEHNRAHASLKRDLYNATKISSVGEETIQIVKPLDTVLYKIFNKELIRINSNASDTLKTKVNSIRVQTDQDELGVSFKSILLAYELLGQPLESRYYKNYGVAEDINMIFFKDGN